MTKLTYDEWQDPRCVSVNKLPPRASFAPFASAADALASVTATRPVRQGNAATTATPPTTARPTNVRAVLLDSTDAWAFRWFPSVAAAGLGNAAASAGSLASDSSSGGGGAWGTMPVPGNWELQGAANAANLPFPIYTNIGYAWAGGGVPTAPPAIAYKAGAGRPADYNPTGVYRRTLSLPRGFLSGGQRAVLHLGAVTSAVYVKVNGVGVGYSTDSKLPAEFDVTDAVLASDLASGGEALTVALELSVVCWCAGSYLEDQDMWHFAGITRSCWLLARPTVRRGGAEGRVKARATTRVCFWCCTSCAWPLPRALFRSHL
jgi:hypothetical protein